MRSSLYESTVMHHRVRPFRHRFTYRVFSLLLDLDEIGELGRKLRLFSHNRFNLFSFRDRDFGDGGTPRAWVERVLVENGVLRGWLLGSYSSRKLGLQTTGNAGGVFNLVVRPGQKSFEELVRSMGGGLIVTELLGSGVNGVTGDYSRGAAGYWVENGAIAYPVQELTIAGSLLDMYRNIAELGSDVDPHGGIRTGSVLVENLTLASAP